jgi:hypothetical protein
MYESAGMFFKPHTGEKECLYIDIVAPCNRFMKEALVPQSSTSLAASMKLRDITRALLFLSLIVCTQRSLIFLLAVSYVSSLEWNFFAERATAV